MSKVVKSNSPPKVTHLLVSPAILLPKIPLPQPKFLLLKFEFIYLGYNCHI